MENLENIHVLMISSQYMPEVYGGAEQQCQKLSVRLKEKGIGVTILTSRKSRKSKKRENIDGILIRRLLSYGPPQLLSMRYFYSSVIWLIKVLLWLYKYKKNYNIIHIHQAKFNAYAGILASKIFRKRSIIKTGNSGKGFDLLTLQRKAFFGKMMFNYVIKNCDKAIAISSNIHLELLAAGLFEKKIEFIPNGVEIILKNPLSKRSKINLRKTLNLPEYKKIYLFAGRLEKQKDILMLIESFSEAEPAQNDWFLLLIGDGELRQQAENMINFYQLNNSVLMAGYKKDLLPYLSAADFFTLSTRTEGLSNALLEAMSAGLVPISVKVSGSTDLVKPGYNGFLTEPGSKQSLTEAIINAGNLSVEDVMLYSKRSIDIIKSKYEMKEVTKQYISLYKEMLN